MPDYAKHCQHIQRIVSLSIAPELPDAVAALRLLRLESWSAAETPLPVAAVAELHPIPSDAPSFSGRVREIIQLAMEAEEPLSLGRLQDLVERRWEEWQARRRVPAGALRAQVVCDAMPNPESAHAVAWVGLRRRLEKSRDEAVEREAELGERSREAAEAFETRRRDAEIQLASYRRAAQPTAAPPILLNALRAGGVWWAVPVLLATLLYLIGQPAWLTLVSGAVAALLVGLRAARAKPLEPVGTTPLARISARVCAPAAEALVRWCELREQSAEAAAAAEHHAELRTGLAAELALGVQVCDNRDKIRNALQKRVELLPIGPLEELRPGLVQITGRDVARHLAERLGGTSDGNLQVDVPARELAADEVTAVVDAILLAVRQGQPEVTLHAAVAAVEAQEDGRMLLAAHLRMLANTATSAARLKPGARLDRTICPEMLSVGLPGGVADPLVEFVTRTFPQAPIMASFRRERMEILYDIANVNREQLRITQMAEQAYSKSSALERRLWHLPRRYRGARQDVEAEPLAV